MAFVSICPHYEYFNAAAKSTCSETLLKLSYEYDHVAYVTIVS